MTEVSFDRPEGSAEPCRIQFPDSDSIESLIVTVLAPGQILLEESPVFSCYARYGDIVEGDFEADGLFVIRHRVQRSGLRSRKFFVGSKFFESPTWLRARDRILELGGNWEQIFGGILIVHLPVDSRVTIDERLSADGAEDSVGIDR